jgi:hypothetical protein
MTLAYTDSTPASLAISELGLTPVPRVMSRLLYDQYVYFTCIFLVFYNIEDDDYHYNIYDFINKIYYAGYYENKNFLLERYI